jgi:hypothetical protein
MPVLSVTLIKTLRILAINGKVTRRLGASDWPFGLPFPRSFW